jgi:hypothetical protein
MMEITQQKKAETMTKFLDNASNEILGGSVTNYVKKGCGGIQCLFLGAKFGKIKDWNVEKTKNGIVFVKVGKKEDVEKFQKLLSRKDGGMDRLESLVQGKLASDTFVTKSDMQNLKKLKNKRLAPKKENTEKGGKMELDDLEDMKRLVLEKEEKKKEVNKELNDLNEFVGAEWKTTNTKKKKTVKKLAKNKKKKMVVEEEEEEEEETPKNVVKQTIKKDKRSKSFTGEVQNKEKLQMSKKQKTNEKKTPKTPTRTKKKKEEVK